MKNRSPLTAHRSPLTAHRSPLTAHRSPLTAHRSKLAFCSLALILASCGQVTQPTDSSASEKPVGYLAAATPVPLAVAELVGLRNLTEGGLSAQSVGKLYSKSLLAEDFDGTPFFYVIFTAQNPVDDLYRVGRGLKKPEKPENFGINDMQFQFIGASSARGEVTASGNGAAFLKQLVLAVDSVGEGKIKRFVAPDSVNLLIQTKDNRYWDVRGSTWLTADIVEVLKSRYAQMVSANAQIAKQNAVTWSNNSQQYSILTDDVISPQNVSRSGLDYSLISRNLSKSGLVFAKTGNNITSQFTNANLRLTNNSYTSGYTPEQCGGWGLWYSCTINFDWKMNYFSGAAGAYGQTASTMGQSSNSFQNYTVSNGSSRVIGCTNAAILSAMGVAKYYYGKPIPSVNNGYDSVQNAAHTIGSVQYVYGRPGATGYNSLVAAAGSSGLDPVNSVYTSTGTQPNDTWISNMNNWFTSNSIPLKVNGVYRNTVTGTAYPMNYWMFTELQNRAGYAPIIAHYAVNPSSGNAGYHSSIITAAKGTRKTQAVGSVADIFVSTPDQPGYYSSITDAFTGVAGISVVDEK